MDEMRELQAATVSEENMSTGGSFVARAVKLSVDRGVSTGGLQSALQAVISAENAHEIVVLLGKTLTVRWDK